MRFSILCASTALAASLLLSACSGGAGGSQAIPGGSSVSQAGHHAPHLVAVTPGNPSANCPSSLYVTCIDISKASGGAIGICISSSGNCSSGLVGDWNWTTTVVTIKGKSAKKQIHNAWSPNPGNPSTNTFTVVKKIKVSKNGKPNYVGEINACEVTDPSDCVAGNVGLIGSK